MKEYKTTTTIVLPNRELKDEFSTPAPKGDGWTLAAQSSHGSEHVVIGKINSVYRTNPYVDINGVLFITVVLYVCGRKLTEDYSCGRSDRQDASTVDSAAANADKRVAQILSYIDAGEAPAQ